MLRLFLYLHLSGLMLIAIGLYLLLADPNSPSDINGMMLIALPLGLGGLMVSPYPIIKAIQWMQKQT